MNEDKPNLGFASTRELLAEVSTRMRVGQNSTKGRELGALCDEAIEKLGDQVLNYRTIAKKGKGDWSDDTAEDLPRVTSTRVQ